MACLFKLDNPVTLIDETLMFKRSLSNVKYESSLWNFELYLRKSNFASFDDLKIVIKCAEF